MNLIVVHMTKNALHYIEHSVPTPCSKCPNTEPRPAPSVFSPVFKGRSTKYLFIVYLIIALHVDVLNMKCLELQKLINFALLSDMTTHYMLSRALFEWSSVILYRVK